MPKVDITEAACEVIDRLRAEHGPLIFHQSCGCCDGSSPLCFPQRGILQRRVAGGSPWLLIFIGFILTWVLR